MGVSHFISFAVLAFASFARCDDYKVPVPYYGNETADDFLQTVWRLVVETSYEFPGYDGWYNNRAHPDWGAADSPMFRRLPHAYEDGVYKPSGQNRPNPVNISTALMSGETGMPSYRGRTAFLVFFGQQVVEEILDAQRPGCPPEYFNITVPKHEVLNPEGKDDILIPLLRSRYDMGRTGFSPNSPREQLNEITPWIDGGLMYGIGKTWADALRLLKGGRLLSTKDQAERGELEEDEKQYGDKDFPAVNNIRLPMANPPPPRDHYLKNVKRFFRLGNPRGNENPFLLTFGIFWYRYHNAVADRITELLYRAYNDEQVQKEFGFEKTYSEEEFKEHYDEKIFNEARKWVIATHQKVIVYDWLPSWLKTDAFGNSFSLDPYTVYKPEVYPQIMHVFQSAAMRFGHTLVPPGVRRRRPMAKTNEECDFVTNTAKTQEDGKMAVRTCNSYWNPQEAVSEFDIDDFILGMSSQITEREDTTITEDLRGFVFGGLDFSRRDLMAVNIQRGRDHGLPDYNTARREFGLDEIKDWNDINKETCGPNATKSNPKQCEMIQAMREVYNGRLDDIDIWPGGIAETTADGPGPLFRAIIADQFTRIRDGDRFWFENDKNYLFKDFQREAILKTTLRDIILEITEIDDSELAENPFFYLTAKEKCERVVGRAQTDGFNLTNFNCTENINCSNLVQAFTDEGYSTSVVSRYVNCNITHSIKADPCPGGTVDGGNSSQVAPCTPLSTFDYFTGSEVPYILTFAAVGLFVILTVALLIFLSRINQQKIALQRRAGREESKRMSKDTSLHEVVEWQGHKEGDRDVKVRMDIRKKSLILFAAGNLRRPARTIDCSRTSKLVLTESTDRLRNYLSVSIDNDYDLVLRFDGAREKVAFIDAMRDFCTSTGVNMRANMSGEKSMLASAVTKAKRQKTLDKFFRVIFKRAFHIDEDAEDTEVLTQSEIQQTKCELTIYEFADALSLKPSSLFVQNMFDLIDKNKNGLVSFQEFLDMFVIFAKGSGADKARLLFDMYDVHNREQLSKVEFRVMLRSLMDLANTTVEDAQIDEVISSMFEQAGFSNKETLTFDDFNRLLSDYKDQLDHANLNFSGMEGPAQPPADVARTRTVLNVQRENAPDRARRTVLKAYGEARATNRRTHVEVRIKPSNKPKREHSAMGTTLTQIANYMENYRLHIFWVTLYTLVTIAIFAERAYYYSVEREHAALRRIAGYGVTVTRGAASGQMFTYSTLLLTMCRNLITVLRETFVNRFVPFDSVIWFHKYVAYLALLFTVIHVVGHSINFYHISTQTPGDLTCLFRNFYRATHVLPKFHYWCWGTITGVTGVVLTLIIIVMYVFAQQYARRNVFRAFWLTHQMFYLVFILMILHGAGILVQAPLFWAFFIGPLTVFVLDKLISLSRNKTEISITKAELLPSEVTALVFKRPAGFEYRSGQWVRIACLDLGADEYHPFTLTSAPHEDNLSLHIRAVGPWTMNIRRAVDPNIIRHKPFPKLYLDGPFGEGHQDWYKFEVAVLVGGGIGVTPFASILKDIVNRASLGAKFSCKKVYFLWVTRSQKQFEWLVDIIREVEDKDKTDFVSVHIFITQFFQKFDLRTTMLYICERHFQKVSNKSLFTGLRSITHFGRPDFSTFLGSLKDEHPGVSKVGVFSCGPPPMTHGVEEACSALNRSRFTDDPAFVHHYENF
ncbi:dual oxidase 2-like [Watersipora subatra]|uniref:dual oxidase 2-like n=1 Tax=Watersipora subatra TaxID=2589382 RepID=UPI00355B875C